MGHYLSEMESDEDYYRRAVLQPMVTELGTYADERRRGILHTPEWTLKMIQNKKTLEEHGYDVPCILRGVDLG